MKTIRSLILITSVLLMSDGAIAAKLKLPQGMGGVPDIGAIPCGVFNRMLVIGPLGTRQSLLTWAGGYYYAQNGKTIDEMVTIAEKAGEPWDFDRLTDHFADYCENNPEAITREAVISLGGLLIQK